MYFYILEVSAGSSDSDLCATRSPCLSYGDRNILDRDKRAAENTSLEGDKNRLADGNIVARLKLGTANFGHRGQEEKRGEGSSG
jgi:hypothetical protein